MFPRGNHPLPDRILGGKHGKSVNRMGNPPNIRRSRAMARFLIEVPHEAEQRACAIAIQLLLQTGSHYLTNADWGCMDGDHKGWVIVDVDSKEQARGILPPVYRSQAKIVKLNKFSLEEIDDILRLHPG
jgi:hypothetical protein